MAEPTLVILAAGMGSRFGGLKQIMAVDDNSHAIIDFSLFDAYRAGFRKLAFIIKREIEESFKQSIGLRMERYFEVKYVYQELDKLPAGYTVPERRKKPWGTGHAVLCCKGIVDGPFAVINADDFYGAGAYKALYDFLKQERDGREHAIVTYLLRNTLTDNGYVARGICKLKDGMLTDVVERTHIEKRGAMAEYTEDGESFHPLTGDESVSMNCWGFSPSMLEELEERFPKWLDENLKLNPMGCEYFLPFVADSVIKDNKGSVVALSCDEKWYGMTYKQDMQTVVEAIKGFREKGIYPESLLD